MHLDKSFPLKYLVVNLCVKRRLSEGVCVCVCAHVRTCVCTYVHMPALAFGGGTMEVYSRVRGKGR